MYTHTIGVDEAGRGPLAGPVAVGAVCVPKRFNWNLIPGVDDSKKLSEKTREAVAGRAAALAREGYIVWSVAMVSAPIIDRIGITKAVQRGVQRSIQRLDVKPQSVFVKLDGLLRAPDVYTRQKTIIKGDQTEKEIALASIMAKVRRDRYMRRMAARYPNYGFDLHKGYGTAMHKNALTQHGRCPLHRVCFTKLD